MHDGLFHTGQGIFEEDFKKLIFSNNLFHCNLAITRENWNKTGGYFVRDVGSIDYFLIEEITKSIKNPSVEIKKNEIFYIYRWSQTGSYHASGIAPYEVCDITKITNEIVETQKKKDVFESGDIILNPHYKYNYLKFVKDLVDTTE